MACLSTGCKYRQTQPGRPPITLDVAAASYVRLAVELGERDADSIDYYYGPAPLKRAAHKTPISLTEIQNQSDGLIKELNAIPVRDVDDKKRKDFLIGQLKALSCRSSVLSGEHLSFDNETHCYFGVTPPAVFDQDALVHLRTKIDALLPGKQALVDRYALLQMRFIVPPSRLAIVMKRAIRECRNQTLKHMTLPSNEEVTLNFTGNHPWAGYSLYQGGHRSDITINTDLPFTVDRVLDLACHETYPGHHVFNMQLERQLERNHHLEEMAVQPTYSPESSITEGAATIASSIAFSPEERLRFEHDELFPLAGLDANDTRRYLKVESLVEQLHTVVPIVARRYIDGDLEFARASAMLEDQALMSNSFQVLKYINEFRSYVVTYTYIPDLLTKSLPSRERRVFEADRWNMYLRWMHMDPTIVEVVH